MSTLAIAPGNKGPSWDNFDIVSVLGSGSFGTIYKVKLKHKLKPYDIRKFYVVKEVDTGNMSEP